MYSGGQDQQQIGQLHRYGISFSDETAEGLRADIYDRCELIFTKSFEEGRKSYETHFGHRARLGQPRFN